MRVLALSLILLVLALATLGLIPFALAADTGVYDRSDLRKVDYSDLPAARTIPARDGTPLAVRVYDSNAGVVVIAIHGSSGNGRYYHPLGRYLSGRGKASADPILE